MSKADEVTIRELARALMAPRPHWILFWKRPAPVNEVLAALLLIMSRKGLINSGDLNDMFGQLIIMEGQLPQQIIGWYDKKLGGQAAATERASVNATAGHPAGAQVARPAGALRSSEHLHSPDSLATGGIAGPSLLYTAPAPERDRMVPRYDPPMCGPAPRADTHHQPQHQHHASDSASPVASSSDSGSSSSGGGDSCGSSND